MPAQCSLNAEVPGAVAQPKRVAFFMLSGFTVLAYAAAVESLRCANLLAGRQLYRWAHVSPDAAPAVASCGVVIQCEFDARATEVFDYVFIFACDEAIGFNDPSTLSWLRVQAARGAVLAGVSGGTFVLARAALLDHHRLTLHWAYAPAFIEEFPHADLRRSLFEIDGKRITCGGGVSPLDLFHAIIGLDYGSDLAARVSDWFLHTDIRDGGKAQRLSVRGRLGVSHLGLIRAIEAMEAAIEEPLPRARLAKLAGVSQRQLERLFLAQVGSPVQAFYLQLRLDRARQLTRQTGLSMLEVAIACGFDRASTFSKSYRRQFGVSPTADRAAFLRKFCQESRRRPMAA